MNTLPVTALTHVFADVTAECPTGGGSFGQCSTGLPNAAANSGNLQSLLQIVFAVAGGIAVIMIVVAGMKFITAQGEPAGVASARKILLFALIGLLVSIFAEVIVSFVIGKLS